MLWYSDYLEGQGWGNFQERRLSHAISGLEGLGHGGDESEAGLEGEEYCVTWICQGHYFDSLSPTFPLVQEQTENARDPGVTHLGRAITPTSSCPRELLLTGVAGLMVPQSDQHSQGGSSRGALLCSLRDEGIRKGPEGGCREGPHWP